MADSEEAGLLQRRARRRLVGAIALALLVIIVIPIVFDREPKPITQDLVIEIPSQDSSKFNPRLLPPPQAEPIAVVEPTVTESRPAEPKAADPGPAEPKAAESKAADPKTADPKPTESKSADSRPAESKVAESKPTESKPAESKAAASKAAESKAAIRSAAKTESSAVAKAEPVKPQADAKPAAKTTGEFVVPLGLFSKPDNAKRLQANVTSAGFKVFSETVKGEKGELLRVRAGPYPSREAAEQARDKLKSKGVNVGAVVPLEP